MKRHEIDLLALLSGLLFASVGVAFLLDATNVWSADIRWVPPIVLIVLGIGGVLSTVGRRAPIEPAAPAAVEPTPEPAPAPPATEE